MPRKIAPAASAAPSVETPADPAARPAAVVADTVPAAPVGLVFDPARMLVFGWLPAAPPARARARFTADASADGTWHCLAWRAPAGDPRGTPFIAMVALDNVLRAQATPIELTIDPDADADADAPPLRLPTVGRIELEHQALLRHLTETAANVSQVYDFLRLNLTSGASGDCSPADRRFFQEFLAAVSHQDGFIEILGVPDYGGLLVQGWSVRLRPGFVTVDLFAETHAVVEMAVATFERDDLLDTARGIVGYAKDARVADLSAVKTIHYKHGDAYFHVDVVHSQQIFLEGGDTVSHLKDMIAKLEGERPVLGAFKRVCRPRFPGHETVSDFPAPVRIACDQAILLPGQGVFVSGWLLDPGNLVMYCILKSTANFYAQLQSLWARQPRPDVSDGYADVPQFAGLLAQADPFHGFMAFVPREKPEVPGEQFYLEVVLKDERCMFLPVALSTVEPSVALRQLLGGVNISDPSIDRLIGAHIGPTVAALAARRADPQPCGQPIAFGPRRGAPAVSVIMPVPPGYRDLDVNLATLSGDADFRDAEVVVIASRSEAEQIAQPLKQQAAFYGLSVTLLLSRDHLDYFDALELGARHAAAPLLLFLSPRLLPCRRGWLSHLTAELRAVEQPALISPTLVYEDDSVCYAGLPPSASVAEIAEGGRFAGYSMHRIDGRSTEPAAAGAAECCLLPRAAFIAAGGFSPSLVGTEFKNADFALRWRQQGGRCYWAPAASLFALDDEVDPTAEYWRRVGRLTDGWLFARRWQPESPAIPGA
jgi:GT2 family glycosyltransferase